MLLAILAFLQEHAPNAAEKVAEGAEHATEASEHGEHVPALVEWVNHVFGPVVFSIQQSIMPPIYKIFGAHWPGEGKTFAEYMADHQLPIPTHIVMFLLVVLFAVVILTALRPFSKPPDLLDKGAPINGQVPDVHE